MLASLASSACNPVPIHLRSASSLLVSVSVYLAAVAQLASPLGAATEGIGSISVFRMRFDLSRGAGAIAIARSDLCQHDTLHQ